MEYIDERFDCTEQNSFRVGCSSHIGCVLGSVLFAVRLAVSLCACSCLGSFRLQGTFQFDGLLNVADGQALNL